ncbi:hypothetical protein DSO57_1037563 [Entomophthora muscae]|uniref:Uncharacterized protein n=1 Tax=Entomophthora muscae TaxID=34485 RepID=A0ACC2RDS1_9FUNG|nr:hypothetical protein DSO57_1037563 [Entomophthora muscae]
MRLAPNCFLILRNSLSPLMLVASDPTVHVLFYGPQGFPVVTLCCASDHNNHSAAKLCASCIPHEKWVQEASKRLYQAVASWFATWVGSQTDNQLESWEELKADITHNFCVTKSFQDIAIQLSNFPQKTTITAYANEFEEIHHKIKTQHKLTTYKPEPHSSTE